MKKKTLKAPSPIFYFLYRVVKWQVQIRMNSRETVLISHFKMFLLCFISGGVLCPHSLHPRIMQSHIQVPVKKWECPLLPYVSLWVQNKFFALPFFVLVLEAENPLCGNWYPETFSISTDEQEGIPGLVEAFIPYNSQPKCFLASGLDVCLTEVDDDKEVFWGHREILPHYPLGSQQSLFYHAIVELWLRKRLLTVWD